MISIIYYRLSDNIPEVVIELPAGPRAAVEASDRIGYYLRSPHMMATYRIEVKHDQS